MGKEQEGRKVLVVVVGQETVGTLRAAIRLGAAAYFELPREEEAYREYMEAHPAADVVGGEGVPARIRTVGRLDVDPADDAMDEAAL